MKRYDLEGGYGGGDRLVASVDGAWIRYVDHCEAMKRIAGDGAQQPIPVAEVTAGNLGRRLMWHTEDAQSLTPVGTMLYAAPAPASPEPMACEILSGPRTHICWTPDGTPPEQREQVVLIRYADFKRLTGSSQAKSTAPAQTVAWMQTLNGAAPMVYLHKDGWTPPRVEGTGYEWRPLGFIGASPVALTHEQIGDAMERVIGFRDLKNGELSLVAELCALLAASPAGQVNPRQFDVMQSLENIQLPMEGYDPKQPGYEWRKGWNDACRYAMEVFRANGIKPMSTTPPAAE